MLVNFLPNKLTKPFCCKKGSLSAALAQINYLASREVRYLRTIRATLKTMAWSN